MKPRAHPPPIPTTHTHLAEPGMRGTAHRVVVGAAIIFRKVDVQTVTGNDGSCGCDEYCATDWKGTLNETRPHWKGATSVFGANSTLFCVLRCFHRTLSLACTGLDQMPCAHSPAWG